MKKKSSYPYVVVFANGDEYFQEVQSNDAGSKLAVCQNAVRDKKLTTSRKNPQKVAVELFALEINAGQLKRSKVGNFEVMPYLERMTQDEYNEALEEAVEDLPQEFQEYVRMIAWNQGHSSGYEEVVNIATDMAGELEKYVTRYQKRILASL